MSADYPMPSPHHLQEHTETFELADAAGNVHLYRLTYHPPKRALPLCLRLSKAGGAALSSLVENNLAVLVKSYLNGGEEGVDFEERLKEIMMGAVLNGTGEVKLDAMALIEGIFDVLIACEEDGLLSDLFALTLRDGCELKAEGHFNRAYMANYAELRSAMVRIVQLNGFLDFLFSGLSKGLSKRVSLTPPATRTQPISEGHPSPEGSLTGSP